MGQKGDKGTSKAKAAGDRWCEELGSLGDVSSRSMFGGVGLFESGKMFAMVNTKGELAFKGDAGSSAKFEAAGASRHGKMPYYLVPAKVEADEKILFSWAREAIRAAREG